MISRDPTTWMWAQALDLLEQADRLHRQFFQLGHSSQRHVSWEPPVDVFETESELAILVALPGVAPEHVQVALDGTALVVRGERPVPATCKAALIHRLEIPYGRFERRIELPSRRFDLDRRDLVDGCLRLTLSKLE